MPPSARLTRPRGRLAIRLSTVLYGLIAVTASPPPAAAADLPLGSNSSPPCTSITKTYTTDPDFNLGTLNGVVTNVNQIELSSTATTWPYAWIANAGEGTISKVDTQTGKEVGRYYTGPPDNTNTPFAYLRPSRTVIDRDGNCWVANRVQNPVRPSVTQILMTGGIDRNNNNIIDTSTDTDNNNQIDPGEILPWGQDERVIRHYELGNTLGDQARGMVIDKTGMLWVGLTATQRVVKVDPNLSTVTYQPDLTPAVAPTLASVLLGHNPYGLALSPNGKIYASTVSDSAFEINPGLAAVTERIAHGGMNYGIAVDKNCIVWIALASSPTYGACVRWDPSLTLGNPNNGWTFSGPGAPAGGTGITVDFNNEIWMACGFGSDSVAKYTNAVNPTLIGVYGTNALSPWGIGVASDGNIIVAGTATSQWEKLNVNTGLPMPLLPPQTVGYGPYTYSDFTGHLQNITSIQQGTWNVITDGGSPAIVWDFVGWTQSTPSGTSVQVEARTGQTLPLLSSATWATIGVPGPQGPMPGRYIETRVRLQRVIEQCGEPFVTPILYDLTVGASCDTCAFANCPADTTIPCESPSGAVFEYTSPLLEPDCDNTYQVTCSPPSGVFPIGTTPVTCTAVNASGDTVRCVFTVTVLAGCDPPPTGACCLSTGCVVTTQQNCETQGGIYFGNGSNCTVGCNYNCIPPFNHMTAWFRLDGAPGGVVPNFAGGASGTPVNNPTPVAGEYVDGAYSFNGSTQYIEVPHDSRLAIGTGDLSIDAWVKTSSASGIEPIVDKRDAAPQRGYGFYLANGYPGLHLAVGGDHASYALDELTAGTDAFVGDGQWHLVAVTVDRDDPEGIHFYVDGQPVGPAFDPTPLQGDLDSSAPLWIARSHPIPTSDYLIGVLDEIEIIHHRLSSTEIHELYVAGAAGKCPELCYASQNVPCCAGLVSSSSFTVCNYSGSSHVYSWGLSTLGAGGGCSNNGPMGFTPPSGTVTVPAYGCVTVNLNITCPSNIPPGQVSCWQVSLFNHDTGRLFACRGSVRRAPKWCLTWSDPVGTLETGVLAIDEGASLSLDLNAGNLNRGPDPSVLNFQIRPLTGHHDDDEPSQVVSLNGLPPGEPVIGTLVVSPEGTETVSLDVSYARSHVIGYDRLAVFSDEDNDGIVEKLGEIAVRAVPTSVLGIPGEGPSSGAAGNGRMFLAVPNPFEFFGHIRFRVDGDGPTEVKLRLFDLAGRSVKIFHMERRLEPGEHSVPWNTIDSRGVPLRAGLYFLKLEVGKDRSETVKVVIRR